jgi:7-carboxy-7-deazaguanine synthase
MAFEEVLGRVEKIGPKTVLLTGGEPMEQAETPGLIERLLAGGYQVVLETNGACDLVALFPLREQYGDRLVQVVDVKCPGSGEVGTFLEKNLEHLDSSTRDPLLARSWPIAARRSHGVDPRGPRGRRPEPSDP